MTDLHERFREEFDEAPVPDLWERIERLAETETVTVRPERSRVLVTVVAAVAALVLIGGPLLLLNSASQEEPMTDTSTTVPEQVPEPLLVEWSRVDHDAAVFGGQDPTEMRSIATDGSSFVAAGMAGHAVGQYEEDRNAAAWFSPDGISWSRVPHDPDVFGGDGAQEILSIAAAGPGYVAVGYRFDEPGRSGVYAGLWTSPDGIAWTSVSSSVEGTPLLGWLSDVTAGGPGVVAVGSDGSAAVWTSVDGLVWTSVSDDPGVFGKSEMSSVVVGGPGLVAVGQTVSYAGSETTDGVTWSHDPGSSHGVVWISVDGFTWIRVPHDESVFGGAPGEHCRMEGVTVGNSGLVAHGACESYTVESDGEDGLVAHGDRVVIWTSQDGSGWSRVPDDMFFAPDSSIDTDQSAYWDLYAVDGGLVAIGPEATWASPDGYTWTRIADHNIDGANDVITTPAGLIAVGGDENGTSAAVWIAERG